MLSFAGSDLFRIRTVMADCGEYEFSQISVARIYRGHGIAAFIFDQAEKNMCENSVYSLRAIPTRTIFLF